MTDLSTTIAPKSDQLNSDDLIAGPVTIRITKVMHWNAEQPIAVHFDGDDGKPYLPCKGMRRVMVQIWGSDGASYVGRGMTLYRDPEVLWGGVKVGGIRISHMTNMEDDVVLAVTASKKSRVPYRVRPLILDPLGKAQPGRDDGADSLIDFQSIAKAQALKGKVAFVAWWNSEQGKDGRAAGLIMTDDLRTILAAAESALADDPFGLPPLAGPTAEQLAAAEAAAFRAADQAAGEAGE